MSNSSNTGFWPIVLFVVVGALVAQLFSGGSSSSTTTTSTPSVNTGSVEYRYAKERFKQEGYSDADSATAADAVIRFHEAQKARNR